MRLVTILSICLLSSALSGTANARLAENREAQPAMQLISAEAPRLFAAQGGGMSLSQAIQSVRRNGNVERIISAETKVSGGRETHHIKVLTKDGKVKTHRVPGRTRN